MPKKDCFRDKELEPYFLSECSDNPILISERKI